MACGLGWGSFLVPALAARGVTGITGVMGVTSVTGVTSDLNSGVEKSGDTVLVPLSLLPTATSVSFQMPLQATLS
jgi:hypothetical protein